MRILVADDHPVMRAGLRAVLAAERDLVVVAEEPDGDRALASIRELQPDVAVLDIQMPGLNGIEVARCVRDAGLRTACVILSLHKEELDVQAAIAAGAHGYVVKEEAASELVRAIRAAGRGEFYLSPSVSGSMVQSMRKPGESAQHLTPRERDVLRLLATGLRSKEIAARLELSPKTVEGHRAALMDKLEIRSVAGLVKYAIRHRLADLES